MDGVDPTLVVIAAVLCCAVAGYIGKQKGYEFSHMGAAGLFLGPIGILIALLSKPKPVEATEAETASQAPQPPQSKE
jgi:hypothetical protein